MKINHNLASLPAGYLFAEIAKRVKEYSAAHPEADILRIPHIHPEAFLPGHRVPAVRLGISGKSRSDVMPVYSYGSH